MTQGGEWLDPFSPNYRLAMTRGIPESAIPEYWRQHRTWCAENGRDAGGAGWARFLDAIVARAGEAKALDAVQAVEVELRAAQAARLASEKERADREYAAHAVSLQEWIEQICIKPDFGETITAEEQKILNHREPRPGENVGAWLMEALTAR